MMHLGNSDMENWCLFWTRLCRCCVFVCVQAALAML